MAQRLLAGLALLLLLGAVRGASGGFSLHPPYFNLAEGARVHASATCGEEITARGAPRPTEDLYCKLVGGPVAGGDPNQTIQVSNRRVPRGPRDPCPTLRIWGWRDMGGIARFGLPPSAPLERWAHWRAWGPLRTGWSALPGRTGTCWPPRDAGPPHPRASGRACPAGARSRVAAGPGESKVWNLEGLLSVRAGGEGLLQNLALTWEVS